MTATAITSLGEVTEVPEKAKRRTYTAEYKLQIVKEADACKEPGDVGALLRREGLYSSHLTTWRQARDRGELAPGAKARKRGPNAAPRDERDKRIAELERQNAKLTARAERAEAIAEIQKKWPRYWDVRSRARNRDGDRRASWAEARRRTPVPRARRATGDVLPAPRGQGAATTADAGASAHPTTMVEQFGRRRTKLRFRPWTDLYGRSALGPVDESDGLISDLHVDVTVSVCVPNEQDVGQEHGPRA